METLTAPESDVAPRPPPNFRAKLTLYISLLMAGIVGLAPLAILLNVPQIVAVQTAGMGIIGWLVLRRAEVRPARVPSAGEYALAFLTAAYFVVSAGAFGFLIYGCIFGGTALLRLTASFLGYDLNVSTGSIAIWVAALTSIALSWGMVPLAVERIRSALFTPLPELQSPYFALLHDRRSQLSAGVRVAFALVFGGLILWLFGWGRIPTSIASQLVLIYATLIAAQFALSVGRPARDGARSLEAIAKLADALGFKSVRSPRIGDPNVDPLLTSLDLFGRKNSRGFVAQIKTAAGPTKPVSVSEASVLPLAAHALEDALSKGEGSRVSIAPVLVLIERKPTPSLWAFAETEHMRIIELPADAVTHILATQDSASVKRLAGRYLPVEDNSSGPAFEHQGAIA